MPLDRVKAKRLLSTAPSYSRLPGGDFIGFMATELQEALVAVEEADRAVAREQAKYAALQREIEGDREIFRLAREKGAQFDRAVAALKDIASSQKGGKGKAEAALKELGIVTQPAAEGVK